MCARLDSGAADRAERRRATLEGLRGVRAKLPGCVHNGRGTHGRRSRDCSVGRADLAEWLLAGNIVFDSKQDSVLLMDSNNNRYV